MQDQLSLFPQRPAPTPAQADAIWGTDTLSAIDELLAHAGRYRDAHDYAELLRCMTRFPQYSLFNAMLLHLQHPQVSRVATAGTWVRRHRRYPRSGSRPLVILAPMAPVLFVYDVADTEGQPLAETTPPAARTRSAPLREVFEKTRLNSELHGICVRAAAEDSPDGAGTVRLTSATRKRYQQLQPDPGARYLVLTGPADAHGARYPRLVFSMAQIFCGHYGIDDNAWWPERTALGTETEEIEAHSVTRLVIGRRGRETFGEGFLTPYLAGTRRLPPFSLNAVIQAAGYIEEMGRSKWTAPKRKSRYKN